VQTTVAARFVRVRLKRFVTVVNSTDLATLTGLIEAAPSPR